MFGCEIKVKKINKVGVELSVGKMKIGVFKASDVELMIVTRNKPVRVLDNDLKEIGKIKALGEKGNLILSFWPDHFIKDEAVIRSMRKVPYCVHDETHLKFKQDSWSGLQYSICSKCGRKFRIVEFK